MKKFWKIFLKIWWNYREKKILPGKLPRNIGNIWMKIL